MGQSIYSPNLEQLTAEGVTMNKFYTPAQITSSLQAVHVKNDLISLKSAIPAKK